jgi:hypothetical protein
MRALPVEIKPAKRNPASYDLVVLGSPVWVGHVSSPMRAYLSAQSDMLPQVALFVTEGGSGGAKALAEMTALAGRRPVAILEIRAKDLAGNWRPKVETFVERIQRGAASPSALSRAR